MLVIDHHDEWQAFSASTARNCLFYQRSENVNDKLLSAFRGKISNYGAIIKNIKHNIKI